MHKNYDKRHNENECSESGGAVTVPEATALQKAVADLNAMQTSLDASVQSLQKEVTDIKAQLGSLANGVGTKPTPAPEGNGVPSLPTENPGQPTVPGGEQPGQPVGSSEVSLEPGQTVKVSAKPTVV